MVTMHPCLWFDREASKAAAFYAEVFPFSQVRHVQVLSGTPSGESEIVDFELWGQAFQAISGGPACSFNPSISFMVNFDPSMVDCARERLDQAWAKLAEGGKMLMPLDSYFFSKHYGWVQDQYGLSWQLILTDPAGEPRPAIIPSLMFVGANYGRAETARAFYTSVFDDAQLGNVQRSGPDQEGGEEGTIMFSDFRLANTWFTAMDSAHPHDFAFNESISFVLACDTQEAIDYHWEALSALPEAEQCGWLKDRFGLSWQIVPQSLDRMMREGTAEQVQRLTQAFLAMKKLNLAALEAAYHRA